MGLYSHHILCCTSGLRSGADQVELGRGLTISSYVIDVTVQRLRHEVDLQAHVLLAFPSVRNTVKLLSK